MAGSNSRILFEDSMAGHWQENWFLDGHEATVEHRDGGLYFAAGTITKTQDREAYHAHHAVLWTKQEFAGDIAISYEMTRMDDSDYGTTLLYIQAQGVGVGPYETDIAAWRELRQVPAMEMYFKHMNLLSLSFRENLRLKRYPWFDPRTGDKLDPLVEPMVDYDQLEPGKTYQVDVAKRTHSLSLQVREIASQALILDHSWDLRRDPAEQMPPAPELGRIGLRHMSTRQFVYRNFQVSQLEPEGEATE